jgi:outer membrane protein OmpA-like peptidoglycan-associated protein
MLALSLAFPALSIAQPSASAQTPTEPPGSAVSANFDFVPGERIVFAEDFSRDRVGNFPERLEMVSGNMEVVEWQGKRWLRLGASDGGIFVITLPEKLPQRFTVEFDLTIPWSCIAFYSAAAPDRKGCRPDDRASGGVTLSGTETGVQRPNSTEGSFVDPRPMFPEMFAEGNATALSNRPYRVRMEADGRYVKLYLDQQRVANIPNADFGRANKLIFEFSGGNADSEGKDASPLLGNLSINAGGKGLYDALMADGHVATQGIYFDVGSDRIRSESTPTLQQIADMLKQHAELKLTVEGHTDNTGNPVANQTLSAKRAQAVVDYLVKTSGIGAGQLAANGLGASMPVGSNDTPEGRQANRRVELVKM